MSQTQLLQKMSGIQRLEQAFKLSDFVRELALMNIKQNFPHLSSKQQLEMLKKRINPL